MSLLNDELSVWEIGFRWAGSDPEEARFRIPMLVRDNFRILMEAILNGHLNSISLNIEKYKGEDREEAKLHIRYWLDDVYACIHGKSFNKELLKWAHVERWAFKHWCERRKIPLPEFWFPPGWALDYEWDEEGASEAEKPGEFALTPATVSESSSRSEKVATPETESHKKMRQDQRAAIACREVAANLWKQNPDMTIASMVKHEVIEELCGGKYYADEVVRRWLSEVAPAEVKSRRGRPRKKNGTEE